MKFKNSPKTYKSYKSATPQETIKRITKNYKKLGISLKYTNYDYFSDKKIGIFCGISEAIYKEKVLLRQFGKGNSKILAKASAYAEIVERFSSNMYESTLYKNLPFEDKKIQEFWNYNNLSSYRYGHSNNVKNKISSKNLLINANLNNKELEKIKKSDICSHWITGFSIIKKKKINVPLVLIGKIQASNGFGAGNTFEEAVTHGVFEVFERYALQEILLKKKNVPTIKNQSITNPKIQKYINKFRSKGIDVIIKDLSLNLCLPVVGILFKNTSTNHNKNPLTKKLGEYKFVVGCDLDLENALIRCFTESFSGEIFFNPTLSKLIKKISGNDVWHDYFQELCIQPTIGKKSLINAVRNLTYLNNDIKFLAKTTKYVSWKKIVHKKNKDFLDDINYIIDFCKKNEWDCIIINHTHPELNFPVVRVIIPGISDMIRLMDKSSFVEAIVRRNPFFVSLYNIKGIMDYLDNTIEVKNKKELSVLIRRIENFLKKYSNVYKDHFYLFGEKVDLISIVSFGSLILGNFKKAIIYFKVLENKSWRNKKKVIAYSKISNYLITSLKNNNFNERVFFNLCDKLNIENIYFKNLKCENPFYCGKYKKRKTLIKELIKTF